LFTHIFNTWAFSVLPVNNIHFREYLLQGMLLSIMHLSCPGDSPTVDASSLAPEKVYPSYNIAVQRDSVPHDPAAEITASVDMDSPLHHVSAFLKKDIDGDVPITSSPVAGAYIHLRLYRLILAPLLNRQCHFAPTCSRYAEEAIRRYGLLRGAVLAADRLSRCHASVPLDPHYRVDESGCYLDPVP
jgi:hypothetical protein